MQFWTLLCLISEPILLSVTAYMTYFKCFDVPLLSLCEKKKLSLWRKPNKNENDFVNNQVFAVVFGIVHILEEAQVEPIQSHFCTLKNNALVNCLHYDDSYYSKVQHDIQMIWEYMHMRPIYVILYI